MSSLSASDLSLLSHVVAVVLVAYVVTIALYSLRSPPDLLRAQSPKPKAQSQSAANVTEASPRSEEP